MGVRIARGRVGRWVCRLRRLGRSCWVRVGVWLLGWWVYRWLARWVVPRVRFSTYYPRLTGRQYHRGYQVVQPGDILLSRDDWKLSTWIIPGVFPHVGLCVGHRYKAAWGVARAASGVIGEVVEAVAAGVQLVDFYDFCRESDRVVILRCRDWDEGYVLSQVLPRALGAVGRPYDNEFAFGPKALYCSEVPLHCDPEGRAKVKTRDLIGLGRRYVVAEDWLKARNVEVVWDSERD